MRFFNDSISSRDFITLNNMCRLKINGKLLRLFVHGSKYLWPVCRYYSGRNLRQIEVIPGEKS